MELDIFFESKLPSGIDVVVYFGKGIHLFRSLSYSKGDTGLMLKSLISELTEINGKKLSIEEIDNLDLKDVSYLASVVSLLLSENFI